MGRIGPNQAEYVERAGYTLPRLGRSPTMGAGRTEVQHLFAIMSGKTSLKIASRAAAAALTPDQERFRYLIAQIEKLRKARVDWDASVLRFRNEHLEKMQPLRATLKEVSRDTVFVLDGLIDQPGWSRNERASLKEILCGTAEVLLEAHHDDVELKAMFDKHSDRGFDAAKREELQDLKAKAEEATGLDLGDDEGILTEEDLVERVYKEMAAREAAAEAERSEDSQRSKSSAEQRRAEENEQQARQSLRDIYRKLASAVHPDREPDPERREMKNALMQKINQAYANNDLFALFEAQIQVEQLDPNQLGDLATQRLRQYNKLLARQLEEAKATLREAEASFRSDYGLDSGGSLSAQALMMLTRRYARDIRAEIERQRQFLLVLASKTSTKRWLKEQRRFARGLDYSDETD